MMVLVTDLECCRAGVGSLASGQASWDGGVGVEGRQGTRIGGNGGRGACGGSLVSPKIMLVIKGISYT